ncbi:hypothetical protein RJL32_003873 [Salmonella enterica]|nr:hypothetical protein [Salmonella enterica]
MSDNTLPTAASASRELISLITLAQQLQSEKDGNRCPEPRSACVDAGEDLYELTQRVQHACIYAQLTERLQNTLACPGQRMEAQGALLRVGEDYAGRCWRGWSRRFRQIIPGEKKTMIPRKISLHGAGI